MTTTTAARLQLGVDAAKRVHRRARRDLERVGERTMAHPDSRHTALVVGGRVGQAGADDLGADSGPELLLRDAVGPRAYDPTELLAPLGFGRLVVAAVSRPFVRCRAANVAPGADESPTEDDRAVTTNHAWTRRGGGDDGRSSRQRKKSESWSSSRSRRNECAPVSSVAPGPSRGTARRPRAQGRGARSGSTACRSCASSAPPPWA